MTEKHVFGDAAAASAIAAETNSDFPPRPVGKAVAQGFVGKCPCCGKGKLFYRWLKVVDTCETCNEDMFHQRADDLPAYLNIFLVGHIVVGTMLFIYTLGWFEMWTMVALTASVSVGTAIGGLQPIKGAVVGFQWAKYMHGFGGDES